MPRIGKAVVNEGVLNRILEFEIEILVRGDGSLRAFTDTLRGDLEIVAAVIGRVAGTRDWEILVWEHPTNREAFS